jgi:hypothetical protein
MEEIINKVAESGLITIDLEKYFPTEEIIGFDIKNFLFMEMLLKEKDFRMALDQQDWSQYKGKIVAVFCSTDAIIPMWAYMLVVSKLSGIAKDIYFGNQEEILKEEIIGNIQQIDSTDYEGKRVVVKGCGERPIPEYAYIEISKKLIPVVKSMMYGEPCSTVPVFKRKN